MCYDIKTSLEAQLKRALRSGDEQMANEIREKLLPFTDLPIHHSSGFNHPSLLIYTDESPDFPDVATWGLVPFWVKDVAGQKKLWNQTLNARGETIFEKPSFRTAAKEHRCLIYIEGFYEHHHHNGKTYPFYIHRRDGEPMVLGGLYSDWRNPETGETLTTFTIVTTVGNSLMARIHNNPKLKGPRMPLIFPEELADSWLQPIREPLDQKSLENLMQPFPVSELASYPVGRLRGKEYAGNVPEISEPVNYPELANF